MDVEPIITNEKEYEAYQRKQMEDEQAYVENPKPTVQYDNPIGPERPTKTSFREKLETKGRDIKENIKSAPSRTYEKIKSGIRDIERTRKENQEYEMKRAKTAREVKSTQEYIESELKHQNRMEELRMQQSIAQTRKSPARKLPVQSFGVYKSTSGKSYGGSYKPAVDIGFGSASYKPAYKPKPIEHPTHVQKMSGVTPRIQTIGSLKNVRIGSFGGSAQMPKIGLSATSTYQTTKKSKKVGKQPIGKAPKINLGWGEIPKIGSGILTAKPKAKSKPKSKAKKKQTGFTMMGIKV